MKENKCVEKKREKKCEVERDWLPGCLALSQALAGPQHRTFVTLGTPGCGRHDRFIQLPSLLE